jgi:uncharacterized protein YukE
MNVPAITMLIWFGLAATAAAQGTPSGKAASPGASSKAQLSEIRSLVHDLQARTEKLRDLMTQYRSLVEQRPQAEGGSPDAKKAHEKQLAKWDTALERLMRRLDGARTAVVETTQRLDQLATGPLPTSLAKDVASARNEAEAQRTGAEQALAKNKSASARASKRAKQPPATEKTAPPIPDDL